MNSPGCTHCYSGARAVAFFVNGLGELAARLQGARDYGSVRE